MAPSFFKVRLWTQTELLEALFAPYDKLDEDLRVAIETHRVGGSGFQGEIFAGLASVPAKRVAMRPARLIMAAKMARVANMETVWIR